MSAKLIKLTANLRTSTVSGSNLDNDSLLTIILHHLDFEQPLALYSFTGRDGQGGYTREGDLKVFDVVIINSSLTMASLNDLSQIHVGIAPVGRDHYAGRLTFQFFFDDGSQSVFDFGDFAVGSFHESHITHKVVHFA